LKSNKPINQTVNYYVLQIIEHDEIGTIRDIKITGSLTKAKKWLNKKIKTDRYSHGYLTERRNGKD